MISSIFLVIGSILMVISIKLFLKERNLYTHGIKKIAKIIKLDSYSYITYGPDKSKSYHYGINPLLEIDVDNKKLVIDYHSYDDMCDLKEGDEVEVIYPEGNIAAITRYSKFGLFKDGVVLTTISLLVIAFAIILMIL